MRVAAVDDAAVVHQEGQRRQHVVQVLAGQAAIGVAVGAQAEEDRVEVREQRVERDVAPDFHAEPEFHAHALEHFAPARDHLALELEGGDAEVQQPADLFVAVEHHRAHAGARQAVGAGPAGRACADDSHASPAGWRPRQVGAPALRQRGIDDVLLHRADADRTEAAVVQGAGAFAQPVLRAHAAANLRQRIGLVAERGGLVDAAFARQLQPLRDAVAQRATVRAVGDAAVQAASRLVRRLGRAEAAVQLAPVAVASQFERNALGHGARAFEEVEGRLVAHRIAPSPVLRGKVGMGVRGEAKQSRARPHPHPNPPPRCGRGRQTAASGVLMPPSAGSRSTTPGSPPSA